MSPTVNLRDQPPNLTSSRQEINQSQTDYPSTCTYACLDLSSIQAASISSSKPRTKLFN